MPVVNNPSQIFMALVSTWRLLSLLHAARYRAVSGFITTAGTLRLGERLQRRTRQLKSLPSEHRWLRLSACLCACLPACLPFFLCLRTRWPTGKACASRAGDPGFSPCFSWSNRILNIIAMDAIMAGAKCYRISARTSLGVNMGSDSIPPKVFRMRV